LAAATALAGGHRGAGGKAPTGQRGAPAAGSRSSSSGGGGGGEGAGRAGPVGADPDLLRCFALVYERRGNMGAHGVQRHYRELDALHLLQVRSRRDIVGVGIYPHGVRVRPHGRRTS
jgi:hypothetical protein